MLITGLGTAVPPQRYAQTECWEALQRAEPFPRLSPRSRAILRKVLNGDNGIAFRHLALETLGEAFQLTPDVLNARFARHAPALATQAAQRALAEAGIQPAEVDALIISTCTGYLCPGLTSYVSPCLGLRSDALLLDLVGQGCGAALPNLRTGEALLASGRCQQVLSVCVEVCSAAFYLDDDPGVLISACLFGDGAGAAVLANGSGGKRRLEWKACGTVLNARDRDLLRFEQKGGMLRNVLSPLVPMLAGQAAEQVLAQVLRRLDLKHSEVVNWVLHPGGREVLRALQKSLVLKDGDLRWSEAVLREYGNLSSASLYLVLEAALAGAAPNGWWWLSSFGAGFSCHGAIVEVER